MNHKAIWIIMLMPETAVDKYNRLPADEGEIRFVWNVLSVEAETESM